jgi:hypothetical protein
VTSRPTEGGFISVLVGHNFACCLERGHNSIKRTTPGTFPTSPISSIRKVSRDISNSSIKRQISILCSTNSMKYFISVLLFLTAAFAWPKVPTPGLQVCTTSLFPVPSLCTVPTTTYSTTTVYVPYTTQSPSTTVLASVGYSTQTNVLTTSTPSTTVTWITGFSTGYITSTYTNYITSPTNVPVVTNSASISTCPIVTSFISTITITRTATICWSEDQYGHKNYMTVG